MAEKLNFRKTALKQVGSFTPAKKGMVAGVGIKKDQPKKIKIEKGTK